MKFLLIIALTLSFNFAAQCQTWGDSTIKDGDIFSSVQVPPKFPGGLNGYYRFLADNLESPKQSSGVLFKKTVQVNLFINKTGHAQTVVNSLPCSVDIVYEWSFYKDVEKICVL